MPRATPERIIEVADLYRQKGWRLTSLHVTQPLYVRLPRHPAHRYADVPGRGHFGGLPVYLGPGPGAAMIYGYRPDGRGEYGILVSSGEAL